MTSAKIRWTLLQAFATYSELSEIQHWILYKDADTQEKAKEGIMTKEGMEAEKSEIKVKGIN
jgi:hypothetical protein